MSAQFSGSVGKANPPGDEAPPKPTEPDSWSPRPPVMPPSIRTAPSVKAPLRLIPPLCLRTHELVRTTLGVCVRVDVLRQILRSFAKFRMNERSAPCFRRRRVRDIADCLVHNRS